MPLWYIVIIPGICMSFAVTSEIQPYVIAAREAVARRAGSIPLLYCVFTYVYFSRVQDRPFLFGLIYP